MNLIAKSGPAKGGAGPERCLHITKVCVKVREHREKEDGVSEKTIPSRRRPKSDWRDGIKI
jgi:hypothetical protein